MGNPCNANAIAKAVVVLGIGIDLDYHYHFQEEFYNEQILKCLNIFVETVINFSNVFELEFEQIFSMYCNENMSEEEFSNFMDPRIKVLSKARGYFGYILPCVFVREIMFRFKSHFECLHFVTKACKCLEKFLESKFGELDADSNWYGLMDYCVDINAKFSELFRPKVLPPLNDENGDDFMQGLSSVGENAYPESKIKVECHANELLAGNETLNNTICKFDSSEVVMKGTSNRGMYVCSENNSNDKHSDDRLVSRTNSDAIFDLSKAISEVFLEDKRESYAYDTIADIQQSQSVNVSCGSEECDRPDDDELDQMYDIVLPDIGNRDKVFNLIKKCEDSFGTVVKSENRDENSENKINLSHQTKQKIKQEISLENMKFVMSGVNIFTQRYCNVCKSQVFGNCSEFQILERN